MSTFYPISAQEMNDHLFAQGFRPVSIPGINELVYGKRVDVDGIALSLRVYSGISTERHLSRSCGKDAIRVCVIWRKSDGTHTGVAKTKHVKRIPSWRKNLDARISEMIPSSAYVQSNGWLNVR